MKFEEMINTIQLGDCYELIKNIPDKSIDLVYVDIPYLFHQGGSGDSELGERTAKKRLQLMGADEKYINNFSTKKEALRIAKNAMSKNLQLTNIEDGIDYSIFDELCRVLKHIYIYIWCSKLQINDIMNYFINKGCNFEILVWCKTNPTPTTNNSWLPDIEYCLMFRENGTKLNQDYDLKHKWYVSSANVSDKDLFKHPTIKPLDFVKKHILHSTQPNDIVLDCFCGSGTTCLACKETGRRYIGIEIDKSYYKIACDRLNGITASGQMSIQFNDKGEMI